MYLGLKSEKLFLIKILGITKWKKNLIQLFLSCIICNPDGNRPSSGNNKQ